MIEEAFILWSTAVAVTIAVGVYILKRGDH